MLKFLTANYSILEPKKSGTGRVTFESESDYCNAGSHFEPKHSNSGDLLLQCDPFDLLLFLSGPKQKQR
jgi:hypothetical protein